MKELFKEEFFESYEIKGVYPSKILMQKFYCDILLDECEISGELKGGFDKTIFGIPIEIDNTIRDGYKLVYED